METRLLLVYAVVRLAFTNIDCHADTYRHFADSRLATRPVHVLLGGCKGKVHWSVQRGFGRDVGQ